MMARSKPFQVNLEPEQHRHLQALSERSGRSMGALVRESVAEYLVRLPAVEDPLAEVIDMFEDRGSRPYGDVGEAHDAYLADAQDADENAEGQ